MAKRASERYSTAYDFAADLRALTAVCNTKSFTTTPMQVVTKSLQLDESHKAGKILSADPISDRPHHSAEPDTLHSVIVPEGLHAFDPHDADFSLDLLPGPRDRQGIPDSLRFWLSRVDPTLEAPFSVGMIYGPSGWAGENARH